MNLESKNKPVTNQKSRSKGFIKKTGSGALNNSNKQPNNTQNKQENNQNKSLNVSGNKDFKPYSKDGKSNFNHKKGYKSDNRRNYSRPLYYQYSFNKVILTKRVDKVISGGRNSSFVSIVVLGNEVDRVGVGTASGRTIVDAITHAKQSAANRMIIPGKFNYIKYKHCASTVILKKRKIDVIRSAGYLSTIFKACGMKRISCKIVGSNNPMNTIYAVFNALSSNIQSKRNVAALKNSLKKEIEQT